MTVTSLNGLDCPIPPRWDHTGECYRYSIYRSMTDCICWSPEEQERRERLAGSQ